MRALRKWLILGALAAAARESPADTGRTRELVRRTCSNSIGQQEITLFGNGTLRLRQRSGEQERLDLAELTREETDAFTRRLAAEDLSEVEGGGVDVVGDWVERCVIDLELADRERRHYQFGRLDSLPLGLGRVNRIVDELVQTVETSAPAGGLPRGYVPRAGDLLQRADGELFEVIGLTSDQRGVELAGVDQPLTLFVAVEALNEQFVAVLGPHSWP